MTREQLSHRADRIERELRAEGVASIEIPVVIGAAFMASLTNLPRHKRRRAIAAHLVALREIAEDIAAAPQAPDGPMPDPVEP
jgi:predicted nuclease with RNAse H fold